MFAMIPALLSFAVASVAPESNPVTVDSAWFFAVDRCQNLLDGAPSPDPVILAAVDEYVSWLAMTHPILKESVRRADRPETGLALLQVPTGFTLVPPGNVWSRLFSPNHHAFTNAIRFHQNVAREYSNQSLSRHEMNSLREMRESILKRWPDLHETQKMRFAAHVLANSFVLVSEFGRRYREVMPADPRLRMNIIWKSAYFPARQITIDWAQSFTADHLKQLWQLAGHFESMPAQSALFQRVFRELPKIVRAHGDVCERTDGCGTTEEIYRVVAERSLGIGGIDTTPEPPIEPAAPVIAQSPPPAEAFKPLVSFDAGEVATFTTDSTPLLPAGEIGASDISTLYHDLQRASELVNVCLSQLQRARVPRPDTEAWAEMVRTNPHFAEMLDAEVLAHAQLTKQTFDRLGEGAVALNRLLTYVDARVEFVTALKAREDRISRLHPRAQAMLGSSFDLLVRLQFLLHQSLEALALRRSATLKQATSLSQIQHLVGATSRQKITREPEASDAVSSRDELLRSLEGLGTIF